MPQAPQMSPEGKFQKGMSKTSQKRTFRVPTASFLPFPREPPTYHSQNFPSPAKQASSITLPGTKVFLMLSSTDSHNDSLAGVPGCAPLPQGP